MLSTAVAALLLQIVVTPQQGGGAVPPSLSGDGSVHGRVRSDATGSAIAAAKIELADGTRAVYADSAGMYEMSGVAPGSHRLRFVAQSYDTLVVDVLLAADGALRLDVELTRAPSQLAPVRVVASAPAGDGTRVPPSIGAWRLSRKDIDETPASDDADAFQLLATAPQAQVQVESQAAVHVRGGSADQNLFLLDGAPVYSPLHGGQTMSAFSPDIVDGMVLHGGAPSARYGGRLSSVIDVRTPAAIPTAFGGRGALGTSALRSAIDVPLVRDRAGLILSGRHSYDGLLRDGQAEVALPGAWSDVFGKLMLRVGNGDVAISSFISENGLGFPSSVTTDTSGSPPRIGGRNQFEWTTATQSASWRQPLGARALLETHLWSARFDGMAVWEARTGPIVLGSRLRNGGGTSVLSLQHRGGTLTAGVEAERLGAHYDAIGGSQTGARAALPSLRLTATPTIGSAFAENEWRVGRDWKLDAGLRGTILSDASPLLEPRLSVTFQPDPRLALSAGYARMHQYSQSLRNEESVLGTILGPDLLVAYGAASVPIASADEIAAAATISLDEHTRLDFDWYARALRGLVLVAPTTGEPFATHDFAVGSGHAWGGGASIERRLERLSLRASWALGTVTRRTADASYHPAFAPGQSATFAAAYKLGFRTRLRSAVWASSGRFTTPIGDDVGWDTRDTFFNARELSGTPEHVVGPLSATRVPAFLRIDFGLRHALPVGHSGASLTGFADVNNALARKNVATYVTPGGTGPRRALVMLPPSVVVGLEWKY